MKLDPRCGLLLLLGYLIALATIPVGNNRMLAVFCVLPVAVLFYSPLDKAGTLTQACYVLPFSFAIAAVALLRGQSGQAVFFLLRSYASILAALLATKLLTTTELLRAMERLGAPRFLILVCEFLLRYLEVLKGEAEAMRLAAICRGAANHQLIATSTIAMLFVRSLERSKSIHDSMLARGFRGVFPRTQPMVWRWMDSAALLVSSLTLGSLRWAL